MGEDKTIKELHTWISNDVTIEQIKAVMWAIMMSHSENEILYIIKRMRVDYEKQKELTGSAT